MHIILYVQVISNSKLNNQSIVTNEAKKLRVALDMDICDVFIKCIAITSQVSNQKVDFTNTGKFMTLHTSLLPPLNHRVELGLRHM